MREEAEPWTDPKGEEKSPKGALCCRDDSTFRLSMADDIVRARPHAEAAAEEEGRKISATSDDRKNGTNDKKTNTT